MFPPSFLIARATYISEENRSLRIASKAPKKCLVFEKQNWKLKFENMLPSGRQREHKSLLFPQQYFLFKPGPYEQNCP